MVQNVRKWYSKQKFAEEYDIHFVFEDNVPKIDFYTVPMVEIFAVDSDGGYIVSVGQSTDLQEDIPICYIDADKRCYLIAENGKEFLMNVYQWKEQLTPCTNIEFFDSFEKAQETYDFLDRVELERKFKKWISIMAVTGELV